MMQTNFPSKSGNAPQPLKRIHIVAVLQLMGHAALGMELMPIERC